VKLTPVQSIQTNFANNFYQIPKEAHFMIEDRIAMRSASDFEGYCYIIVQSVNGMVDKPVFDHLSEIEVPVLAIFGEQDNLIPNPYLNGGRSRDIGEKGVNALPNAQLEMVNKAGHFVQFEQPDKVNQLILSFLTN
jgi:pimeloyl-ACP methyl ester carboxylesterase